MPFVPHTTDDIKNMLAAIGADDVNALFDEIPDNLRNETLDSVPVALSEQEMSSLMHYRANLDGKYLNFVGAGAYEHHIPAAVWELTTRGEYYSAYTPYQAEASQGTLQLIYEYQSMIAALTGMDVANASLYDGASGLAEAVLMAVRAHRKLSRILMPRTVHPVYREVVQTIVRNQGIEIVELDFDVKTGTVDAKKLEAQEAAALVIPQPNFFGALEDVDALTDWAHEQKMLVVALTNPTSLALFKAPGQWGGDGADITVGEGQPLGIPLASGGPYFGFMACKEKFVRQMPGRIVGRTVDLEGKPGFTLTLQAREQHIRRSKATSNICTNQGLMVTAATIYLSILGPGGLARVARKCHANTRTTVDSLCEIKGVKRLFEGSYFHEAALELDVSVSDALRALEAQGIVGGYNLKEFYPELGEGLLICATETRMPEDIQQYAFHMERIINKGHLDSPRAIKASNEV